jgi:hypothetical protein
MSTEPRRNLIRFKEGLARAKCGTTKMYQLINQGKIIAYRDGGRTLLDADSIDRYHASLPRVGGPSTNKP